MRYFIVLTVVVLLMPLVFVSASSGSAAQGSVLAQLYAQLQQLQTQLQQISFAPESRTGMLASGTQTTLPVPPRCDSLSLVSTVITAGQSTKLTWRTTNATKVAITGVGIVPLDGSAVISPATSTIILLTATNDQSTKIDFCTVTLQVKPAPAPVCNSFTASSTTLVAGKSTSIGWTTTNAISATLVPGVGSVTPDGSLVVTPTTTTSYKLTATNASGAAVVCAGPTIAVTQPKPNLSFCTATQKTKFGTLCAIQPSKTDSRILDKSATGTLLQADKGFGYHVFAVPDNWSAAKGVWVHFTGSYGRPYDQTPQNAQSGAAFSDPLWIDEIMEKGYAVLQPAYDNQFTVGSDLCGRGTPGYSVDNCSGAVREMGLTGKGDGAGRRYDDQYNTIDYRLKKFVTYIEDVQKIQLPDTISSSTIDWSKLEVSGHSQGADQTYYIAKQRLIHSACILAGTFDGRDTAKNGFISPDIADWFTITNTIATPKANIRAFMVEQDGGKYSFYSTLTKVVGLPTSQLIVASSSPYDNGSGKVLDPHAATIKDPSLRTLRAKACFANLP